MAGGRNRNSNWKRGKKRRFRDTFAGKEAPKCAYCGQNVRDVLTAIVEDDKEAPVHFDCVIKKITESETLSAKEKVCYLGKGGFGIVYFKNPSDPTQFVIKKRIQIEDERKEISWRKAVSKRIIPQ